VILLLVTIGLLNICLGFGLAMHYGFGPPGLDGIFQAFGPMPPPAPSCQSPAASGGYPLVGAGLGGLGAPHDPFATPQSTMQPGASPAANREIAPPPGALAEEELLGEVRDLAGTAQTATVRA